MIKKLKDLANYLERKALYREAIYLDYLIKVAKEPTPPVDAVKYFNEGVLSKDFIGAVQIVQKPEDKINYKYYTSADKAREGSTDKKHVLVKHEAGETVHPPSTNGDKGYLKKGSFKLNDKEQITLFCL